MCKLISLRSGHKYKTWWYIHLFNMSWWCVSVFWILIGFHSVQGCMETHVRCLKSYQWKYRTHRTFHHIETAESCQAACSKYGSRVNYFTFDVSIHACMCIANCLIDRGPKAENDVTGTVSDADPSDLCEVEASPELSSHLVVGVEKSGKIDFLDLPNNGTVNCTLSNPSDSYKTAFSVIEDQLHACSADRINGTRAIVCWKFDGLKKIWDFVHHMDIGQSPVYGIFPTPDGRMVLFFYFISVFLYDGKTIKVAAPPFPTSGGRSLSSVSCATVISNEEFVVGLGGKNVGWSFSRDRHLYIFNLNTGTITKSPQTPNLEGSKCGAFGPPENRKVFILGGNIENPDPNNNRMIPYNGTIVYDPKSQEFTYPGEDLSNTAQIWGHTVSYKDTFFFTNLLYSEGIWLFDYNRTHPQLVKKITNDQREYRFLSTLPTKALNCS